MDQELQHTDPKAGKLLPWKAADENPESDKVELVIAQRGCTVPVGVDVRETDRDVIIAAVGEAMQEPCTTSKSSLRGFVRLNSPIGSRRLVDARGE